MVKIPFIYFVYFKGGHTTEIIKLCEHLPLGKNKPFVYVATNTDPLSLSKVWKMERKRDDELKSNSNHVHFWRVKRIRDVGQSFITAFLFRAPVVFKQTIQILYEENPTAVKKIFYYRFLQSQLKLAK